MMKHMLQVALLGLLLLVGCSAFTKTKHPQQGWSEQEPEPSCEQERQFYKKNKGAKEHEFTTCCKDTLHPTKDTVCADYCEIFTKMNIQNSGLVENGWVSFDLAITCSAFDHMYMFVWYNKLHPRWLCLIRSSEWFYVCLCFFWREDSCLALVLL